MATIRGGSKTVLMVVDVQVDVMDGAWNRDRVIESLVASVAEAREAGMPVVWVQHADGELVTGEAGWQWVPELDPAEGELLIHKNYNSAFEQTSLETDLAELGVSHVLLAGAATNWCIRSTAFGALNRGYDLTLLSDAHTTRDAVFDDGTRAEATSLVKELNQNLPLLEYPGVTIKAAPVSEVDFG